MLEWAEYFLKFYVIPCNRSTAHYSHSNCREGGQVASQDELCTQNLYQCFNKYL